MKFLHEFNRFGDNCVQDNGYWEIRGNGYVYNMNGGRHSYRPSEEDEIIEVESWDEIIKKTIRDDSEITGWLSPDGEFFGCSARNHMMMAEYYFGKSEEELEESGFIKIYEEPIEVLRLQIERGEKPRSYGAIILKQFATENQKITLERKGFEEIAPRRWVM